MAYKSGNLTFVKPLYGAFTLIRNFVCGFPENNDPVFTPAVPRTLASMLYYFGEKPDHAFTAGTWTITCTVASPGAATFSVVHTTYGALADATENVYYDEAEVCFKISTDAVEGYKVGDKYEVVTTTVSANDTPWLLHTMVAPTTNDTYCQMEGPGLTGDQHINVIMRPYFVGSTYNIGFKFSQGYTADDPYDPNIQPGVDNNYSFMAVESSANFSSTFELPYYIFCNDQRFIILLTANTTNRASYCGYFYPYGSPGQYLFPMFIGSEQGAVDHSSTSTSGEIRSFVDPGYQACRIALPGPDYQYLYHYNDNTIPSWTSDSNQMWPFGAEWGNFFYQDTIEQMDGNYSMFPCVIRAKTNSPDQMLGELDGVCAVPGNNLTPGDIIQNSDGDDFVVWRDTFRSDTYSYYAVRLL